MKYALNMDSNKGNKMGNSEKTTINTVYYTAYAFASTLIAAVDDRDADWDLVDQTAKDTVAACEEVVPSPALSRALDYAEAIVNREAKATYEAIKNVAGLDDALMSELSTLLCN